MIYLIRFYRGSGLLTTKSSNAALKMFNGAY
jgi:hypothetical protein